MKYRLKPFVPKIKIRIAIEITPASVRALRSMRGHTLLEILAALGLSAMVIGAALSLLNATRQHSRHLIDAAQQRLDAYAALSVLGVHGRLAGYRLAEDEMHPKAMSKAASATAVNPTNAVRRVRNEVAIFGDAGETWSAARRGSSGPQQVSGSEQLTLRYRADKVSVWVNQTNHMPADCEGRSVGASAGTIAGTVVDAHMRVLTDAHSGEASLHCSSSATSAGGPLVSSVASTQFSYWLEGESQPRGVKEMVAEDWMRVIGFDVCMTMHSATKKRAWPGARGADDRVRDGTDHRHSQAARGDVRDGPGRERCYGANRYYKTVALRNTVY